MTIWKSIIFAGLILATPLAFAGGAFDRLLESDHRPTMRELRAAYNEDPSWVLKNFSTYFKPDPRIQKLDASRGAKAFIVAVQDAYPGAKLAFVGRDSAFLADIFEAYYLDLGIEDKVVRLDISEGSLQSNAINLEYLKQNGLSLDAHNRPTRPYIIIDATSWRGTLDQGESQARRLIEALYSVMPNDERIFLLNRFNAIGQGTSSITGEKRGGGAMNGKPLLDEKSYDFVRTRWSNPNFSPLSLDMREFFGGLSIGAAGPSEIAYLPGIFAYGEKEWHGKFGPLQRNQQGKLVTVPEGQSDRATKENIIRTMLSVMHKVSDGYFARAVEITAESEKEILKLTDDFEFNKFLLNTEWSPQKFKAWYEQNWLSGKLPAHHGSLQIVLAERFIEILEHMYKNNLFSDHRYGKRVDFRIGTVQNSYEAPGNEMEWFVRHFTSLIISDLGLFARAMTRLQATRLARESNFMDAVKVLIDGEYRQWVNLKSGTASGLIQKLEVPNTFNFYYSFLSSIRPGIGEELNRAVFPMRQPGAEMGIDKLRDLISKSKSVRTSYVEDKKNGNQGIAIYDQDRVLIDFLLSRDMGKYTEFFEEAYKTAPAAVVQAIARLPRLSERPKLQKMLIDYLQYLPSNGGINDLPADFRFARPHFESTSHRVLQPDLASLVYSQEGIGYQSALNEAFHARGANFYFYKGPKEILKFPQLMEMSIETFRNSYSVRDLPLITAVRDNLLKEPGVEPFREALNDLVEHTKNVYDPAFLKPVKNSGTGDYIEFEGKILIVTSASHTPMSRWQSVKSRFNNEDYVTDKLAVRDAAGESIVLFFHHNGKVSTVRRTEELKSLVPFDSAQVEDSIAQPATAKSCGKAVSQ